jgi:hypothetical protein
MKIIALIPSYNRKDLLKKLIINPILVNQVDDIMVLEQDMPLGVSKARKILTDNAYEKYGDGNIFLMLDDDSEFSDKSDIIWAAKHFEDNKTLGILQIPLNTDYSDYFSTNVIAYHNFFIKSDLIGQGINYTIDEYLDEILLSLDAYFEGYIIGFTSRCSIHHHVNHIHENLLKGGCHDVFQTGLVPKTFIMEKYQNIGYINCELGHYKFQHLPNTSTIYATELGKQIHEENNKKLIDILY